jgi:class III poly(R)-hydroxyalkanoic acid synthase PhaE subunit
MANAAAGNAWLKDWDALGKQFWNAWTESARAGMKGDGATMHPGFDLWAQLFANQSPQHGEAVERMLASGKQFAALMESALKQFGGKEASKPQEVVEAWRKATHEALGGMTATKNPVADAMRQAVGEGSKGFQQMFGDFIDRATPFKNEMLAGMNLPAFGYTREKQQQAQAFGVAMAAYGEALAAYNAEMLKASQRGLALMESKLADRSEPGREITSLRGFYDVWIDAMEEGYAEVALSDEFRAVYGDLVNAQMKVRQLVQQEVERNAGAFGMPTRTELDGVLKKLAEVKRELAALREAREETAAPVKAAAPKAKSKPKPASKGAFAQKLAAARAGAPRKSKRK